MGSDLRGTDVTKQQALAQAEEFVRKVVTETFGQKTSAKIIKATAQKVVAATPIVIEGRVKKTA